MTSKTLRHTMITILLIALTENTQAGLISDHHHHHHEEHEEHHEPHHHHEEHEDHHHHHHHHHIANSYMHFHGPVEGPEFEVKVPYFEPHHHHHHEHHHEEHDHKHEEHNELHHDYHHHEPSYVMDYVAHPKYEFSYGVEDHHTGDFHSQKETRDGSSVSGVYSIAEPGGRVRVVSYRADKDGFHADVHMTGKNDHSGYETHHEHHPQLHAESTSHVEQQYHQRSQQHGEETQRIFKEYPASFPVHQAGGYA